MFHKYPSKTSLNLLAMLIINLLIGGKTFAQLPPLQLDKAASAIELPVKPWGPFARKNLAPCYLASRIPPQLFTFPIVVGQQRNEIRRKTVTRANGANRTSLERVILLRRASGLAPFTKLNDATGKQPVFRITDADPEGLLYRAEAEFTKASVVQHIAQRTDAQGLPVPTEDWGAGNAIVEYFPAFAENDIQGLLIRVTVTNRSDKPENYFIDLLGSIDKNESDLDEKGIKVAITADRPAITLHHEKCAQFFALSACQVAGTGGVGISINHYQTGAEYFDTSANIESIDQVGNPVPQLNAVSVKTAAARKEIISDTWARTRVNGISVEPGQTRAVYLCVGVGRDPDEANANSQLFLNAVELPAKESKDGVYSLALKAHESARFQSGVAALDILMANSFAAAPFHDFRRVGAPTREDSPVWPGGIYRPCLSGWMAIGWAGFRPDWAAAQINAWLLTSIDPDKTIAHPVTVPPVDILALWELFQQTHDENMLAKFYPSARRRYLELLAAGRTKENTWLFGWTTSQDPKDPEPAKNLLCSPDYSAYIIRSAKILRALSKVLNRPPTERVTYSQDIIATEKAMNEYLWDAAMHSYLSRHAGDSSLALADKVAVEPDMSAVIEELFPLLAGDAAVPAERASILWKRLLSTSEFWSDHGIRSIPKSSKSFRASSVQSGIHYGVQWLFWKALLDKGDSVTSSNLASNVFLAYHTAQQVSGSLPEALNSDTGSAIGELDYTGDSLTLISMYEAYHVAGRVTAGWDILLLDSNYDKSGDKAKVVFRPLTASGAPIFLCVMGKPNSKYRVTGAITSVLTSDSNSVLIVHPPKDSSTQQIEIMPAP